MKVQVIGNLGGDAEVRNENGIRFVSMSIADTRRRRKEDGTYDETTTWVSATLNGDGGNLLQYLKQGTKVMVYGDAELRQYHSEKQRRLVPGIKVFVRDLEIISTLHDDVPRTLYDADGIAHQVGKFFFIDEFKAKRSAVPLLDVRGRRYICDKGWVSPVRDTTAPAGESEKPISNDEAF